MTEPKRVLSDPTASDFQRTLLGSWDLERPAKGAREKALAALGVAAIGTTAAGTTLTGGAGAASAATGGSIAPKAVATLAWAKWASITALMIGGGVAAVVWTAHRAPTNPLPQAPSASMAAPLPPPTTTTAIAAVPAGSAPLVALPSPDLLPTPSASPHPHPSSAQSAPPSLSEQLRHLERARAALDAGDGATAERLVDEYEARYRGGAFVQEAEVLRIEASLQRGNRARAERLEAAFLEKFPKSPHAARVRALLDSNP